MPNKPIFIRSTVKASHLVLTGYGHWLPNDPRGSGSAKIRKLRLEMLGPIYFGRKKHQPARADLKAFHWEAGRMLAHPVIWFDGARRDAIAKGIELAVSAAGHTVWACAVLTNHLHLVVRTHRDDSIAMLARIAQSTYEELHARKLVPVEHPIWSERPYKVFLKTAQQVKGRIDYVEKNPIKEGLAPQFWGFVQECEL
jgi:REP element-mobilizing transposase RayT